MLRELVRCRPTRLMHLRDLRPRRLRLLAAWLLAVLVPLQGLAVTLIQVRGPGHTHVVVPARIVLVDFRRDIGPSPRTQDPLEGIADAWHGHSHGTAQFHHHAFDDRSVVYADGERFGGAIDHDDGTGLDAAPAFLPLPSALPSWAAACLRQADISGPLWTPTAAGSARLERPPRA